MVSANFPIAFGRYHLVERLAVGGMAELFLADVQGDHGFAKRVVIKRILPQLAADPHFTAMFISEAKITARLIHPKIAQTHRLGRQDGQLFIEMEYVDGLDVLAMLRECAHRRVRLPPEVSVYIMKEVLDGLDFAHRLADDGGRALDVVHRDISPSNVLVSRRGNVKVVDFGIAQAAANEQQTRAGTLKGKYGYMSPEQVMGSGVTARSDLFSVGIVLAEMLMGRRLFAAPNELDVLLMVRDVDLGRLERFGGHIPEDLGQLLRRALQKDPGQRFGSAAEMREALDEWLFEGRLRVGAGRVADLVESLYEDAHRRRRVGLDEIGPLEPAPAAPLAATAAGEVADTARVQAPEIEGIPAGSNVVLGGADEHSEVEIVLGAAADPPATPEVPAQLSRRRERRLRELERLQEDEDLSLDEEVEVDLSGIDDQVPARDARGVESIWRRPVPAWGAVASARRGGAPPSREADDGIPINIDEPETLVTIDRGARATAGPGLVRGTPLPTEQARFPSISAAVASVHPARRDPSSRDFDGTGVPGLVLAEEDIRSGAMRLPSPDEIARAPRPAPPALDEISETPAQQGDLAETSPISVLFQLVISRADGLLVVSVGGIRKEIYIRGGVPTYVSSNVASELFGAYLVGEGAISSGELDMALAMIPHFGGKLGDTLVGLGLMKPLEVFRLLTRQIRHKLIDVCTWTKGAYTWYPGRGNKREAFPLDLDPFEVLGAGALALREEFLWKWSDTVHAMRPRAADRPQARPEQLKIGRIGRDVLHMLDGRTPVSDLIARRPGSEERLQFLRILFLFLETGLAVDSSL